MEKKTVNKNVQKESSKGELRHLKNHFNRFFQARLDDDSEDIIDDTNGNHVDSLQEKISKEMKTTVEAIAYIAEHMKREMSLKKVTLSFQTLFLNLSI